ncbi:hypothetical protein D3C76_1627880 [compost metagenome]
MVLLPGAVDRAAGGQHADGAAVLPRTAPALSAVATMAPGQGDCAVLDHHRAAVPAEAVEHHPDLGQGRERVRRQVQGDAVDAAGDAVLHAAGAGADDFPHPFRARRIPRLGCDLELAAA